MNGSPVKCRRANPHRRGPQHSPFAVIVFLVAVIGFTAATHGQTQVIPLRSGDGRIGEPDANIRVLASGAPVDLAVVQAASFAVVSKTENDPNANLSIDPAARWIGPPTGQDGGQRTALYAVPFTVNAGPIASAKLQYLARHDGLAKDRRSAELRLNGRPMGEIQAAADGTADEWFVVDEIAPWLTPGVNWLYMSVPYADLNGGLIFSARVSIWRPADRVQPAGDAFAGAAYGMSDEAAAQEAIEGCVGFTCRPRGDLDSDHDVDLDDYYRFGKCIRGPNALIPGVCEYADFECDGKVDLSDIASFQAAFDGP